MCKKKNLFILHTQYNIILATAIINHHYSDCHNDLILYPEFKVTEGLLNNLQESFNNILLIRDNYCGIESNPIKREWQLCAEYH